MTIEVLPTVKKKSKTRRGQASLKRRQDKRQDVFLEEAAKRRARNFALRCPQGGLGVHDELFKVAPYLYSITSDDTPEVCAAALDFYASCGADNPYVEVRKGVNVANPDGLSPEKKGLFARVDLDSGIHVCLYSGKVLDRCPNWGAYIVHVQDSVYIDAERELHDLGYLWAIPIDERKLLKTPYNHGRYVNTLSDDNLAAGLEYNCEFCIDESGLEVVWVRTLRPISAGEELLADYGK
mmetsp:Transcript_21441/g.31067  ORF Transcript_21441/g.31067 Transcript_21441/m.31067 type:complete len:238 (+) Transcript_21441:105-818(+)